MQAFDLFVSTYEAKYPKGAVKLEKDRDELLAFYDFPATHWQSLRTRNRLNRRGGHPIRDHPASDEAVKGLPDPPEHAPDDVQVGSVRGTELAKTTRLQNAGESDHQCSVP